ncbi:hypothetical protein [Pseudomonas proteolytica]|uniref:hypothetical protein n=1 Tax=Pseudomonas proteolytica TaxID=219574 RepID=UPI0030D94809
MDRLTIDLFFEDGTSSCLSPRWRHWNRIMQKRSFHSILFSDIANYERYNPNTPHYWSNDRDRLEQFARNVEFYIVTRKELSQETLSTRKNLLFIANNIQLFGDSVIKVIDSTEAGMNMQSFTQAQIAELNSSILSIQDASQVQNLSNYIQALQDTTSSALEDVSKFQKKVSDLKVLLANDVRPVINAALATSLHGLAPNLTNLMDAIVKNPKDTELKSHYSNLRFIIGKFGVSAHSSPIAGHILEMFLDLSESLSVVQPALSKFEVLWIDTCSLIRNSKENADTINNVKMLKVFRTRMQKIMNDWNGVKSNLGDQPVALE